MLWKLILENMKKNNLYKNYSIIELKKIDKLYFQQFYVDKLSKSEKEDWLNLQKIIINKAIYKIKSIFIKFKYHIRKYCIDLNKKDNYQYYFEQCRLPKIYILYSFFKYYPKSSIRDYYYYGSGPLNTRLNKYKRKRGEEELNKYDLFKLQSNMDLEELYYMGW